jgi:sugar lactone lactonase YvrE
VYVWNGDGTIQRFDENGVGSLFTTTNLSGWNGPVGLALDNTGNLYAGVPGVSIIWKFKPDGSQTLIGYLDSISGLAFDGTGTLYATLPNYAEVGRCVYGQAWGYPAIYYDMGPYSQTNLLYPVNMAFDESGKIYVANGQAVPLDPTINPNTNTIERFTTDFKYLGSFATGLNNPWGLAFDGSGMLYVANSGTNGALANTIVKFNSAGVRSTFATSVNGLRAPRGLAFDSAGNLYVANSGNGTLRKFTPDGASSSFASGLSSPTSIAIFPGLKVWSAAPITLRHPKTLADNTFQFDLTENPGLTLNVLATTNLPLSSSNWSILGGAAEISPGNYQFIDSQATNTPQRFYRVSAP